MTCQATKPGKSDRRKKNHLTHIVFIMKKILFIIPILLVCAFDTPLQAQQEAMFSRYMFNTLAITPAYAGSHEALRFSMQGRRQWMGIAGSPATGLVSADGVSRDTRAGWGILAGYETIGLYRTTELHGNYAYRMEMGEGNLALGIRAGGTFYQHQASAAELTHPGDALYQQNQSFFMPKMGVGAYYQDDRFFMGFSVPNLATYRPGQPFTFNDDRSFVRRHYFAHTGFITEMDRGIMLKPSILVKYVKGAPVQADINAQLYINNKIGFGAGYRTGDAFSLMIEFFPNEQLRLGYSYDATTSRLANFGANAHEIILGYELSENRRRSGMRKSRHRMQDIKHF
jgi:type IX secretion system PorP/SprF family membrane protein